MHKDSESSPVGFPSTLWSDVLSVADPAHAATRRDGLETLIRRYWKPVYWYVRLSRQTDAATAMDLTQSFFVRVLESGLVERADASRGRFRSFLKVSLRNFLTDQDRASAAERRGGTALHLSLDDAESGAASILAAGRELGPERLFEREWCATVVQRALAAVRERLRREGHETWLAAFEMYDVANEGGLAYSDVASKLGVSEDDVRNHLRFARQYFREAVRAEVRETVGSPSELGGELRELFSWLDER